MFDLDLSTVKQWMALGNLWCPAALATFCPICGERVTFATQGHQYIKNQSSISAIAQCPACQGAVYLWIVEPGPAADSSKRTCCGLAMYPRPIRKREPIPGVELIPEKIRRSYEDVIKVFNTGVWTATATCCRRTLEGVVAHLLPESERGRSLAQDLRSLQTKVDLAKPIHSLSDGLRAGGNIGAHFDLEREPDKETAEAMVDLIDYLLEYVFTLPELSEKLNERLSMLDRAKKS